MLHCILTVAMVALLVQWMLLMQYSVMHVRTQENTWKSSTCVYQVNTLIAPAPVRCIKVKSQDRTRFQDVPKPIFDGLKNGYI